MTMIRTAHPPLLLTSLPANPVDGQEIYFDTLQGPVWHLRYSTVDSGWRPVGATPLTAAAAAAAAALSVTYSAPVGAPALTITLPADGDYRITTGARLNVQGAGAGYHSFSLEDGAVAASDDDAARLTVTDNTQATVQSGPRLKTGLTGGLKIEEKARAAAVTTAVSFRHLSVLPVLLG